MLILDVQPHVGISRIVDRGDRPNAFETLNNLNQCRDIFLGMRERPGTHIIDATQPAEDVLAACHRVALLTIAQLAQRKHGFTPAAGEAIRQFIGTTAIA